MFLPISVIWNYTRMNAIAHIKPLFSNNKKYLYLIYLSIKLSHAVLWAEIVYSLITKNHGKSLNY